MSPSDQLSAVDLDRVHHLTGIDRRHLDQMQQGMLSPGWYHIKKLEQVLSPDELTTLLHHRGSEPVYVTTPFGRVPDGHLLLEYISPLGLVPGDLLAYRPPSPHSGSHWVEVDEYPTTKGIFVELWVGGCKLMVDSRQSVRVARPSDTGDGK